MSELTMTRTDPDRGPRGTYRQPMAWQLAAGPGDGRWGRQARRYEYMNAQCRYCGDSCPGPANGVTAHPKAQCLACGTPQCDKGGSCIVCLAGFVGRPPFSVRAEGGQCGYARCDGQAVARAPRAGRVCLGCLSRAKSRGQSLQKQVADCMRERDLGGFSWQQLAWFGPPLRYAVRRWHDDGRTGWTTGPSPRGYETAGQADREAAAWNEGGGWHAERVTLSPELWDEIRAWQVQPSGRSS